MQGFNSNLVRLKVAYARKRQQEKLSFNSNLVRLKGGGGSSDDRQTI